MRLRICCCYCTDDGPALKVKDNSNAATLPRIVAEQPKLSQSVRLDRTTSVISEESAAPVKEFSKVTRAESVPAEESPAPVGEIINKSLARTVVTEESAAPVREFSRMTRTETEESASPVKALQKNIFTEESALPVREIEMQTQASVERPSPSAIYEEELDPPTPTLPSSTTASVTSSNKEEFEEQANVTGQANSGMSFNVIAPGHLKATYKETEYYILHGEIDRVNGSSNEADMAHVLAQHAAAMNGVRQAMLGLEQGLLGPQVNAEHANVRNLLTALQQPLKRPQPMPRQSQINVKVEEFKKKLEYIRNEVHKESLATQKEDRLNSHSCDDLDGSIFEPAPEEISVDSNELVYDDPETYEALDSNELPYAKPVDEYIISRDESVDTGNTFYFHASRPARVRRKSPDFNERLRIASPTRFAIFESECLKEHNRYRRMHGVPPLVHNPELSKFAKDWAEHLARNDAFYHRPNNEYGENLYRADRLFVNGKTAVKDWYDEIELYDYDNPGWDTAIGHFTQLIWRDSRELGTGVAQIGDKIWVCCNYHPKGNYMDKFDEEHIPRPLPIAVDKKE